ncbi:amino acid synthesis family protein [Allopusillimonas soli]|uniref:Amino acid synthesis family protein n=1 Tax=Allopusillimonas soli TaxID=659016 RepID=A0A853FA20_9BURK|nr:amino acid synthesis family protein [Allopusillimonas soli]NYT36779.1 amino acid synthesis family protein [Allopusillimonas soli]TEA75248.1 amino acid synthesis family protein [Allopusillimonas soli]
MDIQIRKKAVTVESLYSDGGPATETPLLSAVAYAVVKNPYASRYEPDLIPFMKALRKVGLDLATQLADLLGKDKIEAYGKAAIVGLDGEAEHGAVWHEAGGWAMREVLGNPKAMVPASQVTAAAGFRLIMPLHYIHASYVRSHFNSIEVGAVDAPRAGELLFALGMATGGRLHSRLGGLAVNDVSVHDGQR